MYGGDRLPALSTEAVSYPANRLLKGGDAGTGPIPQWSRTSAPHPRARPPAPRPIQKPAVLRATRLHAIRGTIRARIRRSTDEGIEPQIAYPRTAVRAPAFESGRGRCE